MEFVIKLIVALIIAMAEAVFLCILVMLLWNAAVPAVFPGVRGLDLWHAFCITWLCVILFKSKNS